MHASSAKIRRHNRFFKKPTLMAQQLSICLQCRRPKRLGFDPWVRKFPWRKKWQLTPVILLGKSRRQKSLVGYSPWGHKELDMAEHTHIHKQRRIMQLLSHPCLPAIWFPSSEADVITSFLLSIPDIV